MKMNFKKITRLFLISVVSFALFSCKKDETVNEGSITLNYQELSITSDSSSSAVLFATLENLEGNITWTSSDPSTATVTADNDPKVARVKGLKPGSATIKVSIGDKYAECRITVSQGEFLNVSETKIELAVGKTEAINAEAHVSDITFSSSNENVATVTSDGLVSGIAEGNAIITVKAGTKKAYVTVVVEEAGVEFEEQDDIIIKYYTDPTAKIILLSKGGVDASQGVWSIDDETVADITYENGELLIEALETGIGKTTTIRYNLSGYSELTKNITVKDIDLTLDLTPLTGTFSYKETQFKLDAVLTPAQEGARADIIWSTTPAGIIDISPDGTITRNAGYVYTSDEVLVTITAKSVVDPEAEKAATIMVESPSKGTKYITDLNSFNQVMTAANKDAAIYLMADIDLGGKVYAGSIMPSDFNGYFHGNGHKIFNFTAQGVFGSIYGTVENLAVIGNMIGSQRGFLAFHIIASATVKNIFIDVTFKRPSTYIAGLALLGKASNVIIIARNTDNIPVDQVYGGLVQGGACTDVVLSVTGSSISVGGTGIAVKTDAQLKTSTTFANFDANIWHIENGVIPYLIFQNEGGQA